MSAAETVTFEVGGRPVSIAYLPRNGFIVREVFQDQSYRPIEFVGDVTSILDIGANIGASSVYFHLVYPGAQIHAFEPGDGAYELLVRNAAPYPQIVPHNVGLWSTDGTASLFVGDHDYATASLAAPPSGNRDADRIELRACGPFLDSLGIERIDIVKLDTEGCEVPILEDLIARCAMRVIYLEFHSEEDRLRIEEMLRPDYCLFTAAIQHLHRGTLCFVSRRAVDAHGDYHRHRIVVAPDIDG
ncbi:MAG: FkbM family methyltransferase [Rhodospirillaceae bacterium]